MGALAFVANIDCIATTNCRVIICSGGVEYCENDAALAIVLGAEIAGALTNRRSEDLSNLFFKYLPAIPAAQYAVTLLFLPGLWFLTIPYLCLYGGYLWDKAGSELTETMEEDYLSLLFLHRAGYDITDGIAHWNKY